MNWVWVVILLLSLGFVEVGLEVVDLLVLVWCSWFSMRVLLVGCDIIEVSKKLVVRLMIKKFVVVIISRIFVWWFVLCCWVILVIWSCLSVFLILVLRFVDGCLSDICCSRFFVGFVIFFFLIYFWVFGVFVDSVWWLFLVVCWWFYWFGWMLVVCKFLK